MTKTPQRILIVEDENNARTALAELLTDDGFSVVEASTLQAGRTALDAGTIDAVLLDLQLPDGDGQQLLDETPPHRLPPTIVMTAFGSGARAITAMRAGAYDYVQKPVDPDDLTFTLRRAIDHAQLAREVKRIKRSNPALDERIVGTGSAMQRVFKLVGRVAQSHATVLLLGESGTGKELVANAIHDYSARASGPFVPVNCAAVPEALLEAELFGHEKGAFTNALAQRIGRFELANGGTLFLDEIGELTPSVQAKLLRALQEHAIERLGSNKALRIDARIIAATNRDLQAEVAAGRFREDLFYRLNVVEIALPPLRERLEDVPALTDHILARAARRDRRPAGISPAALAALRDRVWRGNVRELENTLERAIVLSGGAIDVEHLQIEDPGERAYRTFAERAELGALEELLTTRSVTSAAQGIGISADALDRRLAELRARLR